MNSPLFALPQSDTVGTGVLPQPAMLTSRHGGSGLVWPSRDSHLGEASFLGFILPLMKTVLLNYEMFQAQRKAQKLI